MAGDIIDLAAKRHATGFEILDVSKRIQNPKSKSRATLRRERLLPDTIDLAMFLGVRRNKAGKMCKWIFSNGQSIFHGRGPSDDEDNPSGTTYVKVVSNKLCISEKDVDSRVDLNTCRTKKE